MGENCTALLFVDVAAFRIDLTLAERFDAQIRVEKTPCGSRAVCVGKNKHQAVWVESLPLCFSLDTAANRFDTGEIIPCTDLSRENAMRQLCRLRWQKINIKRYGWKLYRFVLCWMQ
jgi:hypothetical protein